MITPFGILITELFLLLLETTNSIEGWHRVFNDFVNVAHPNIGRFVDCLQQQTETVRVLIARGNVVFMN